MKKLILCFLVFGLLTQCTVGIPLKFAKKEITEGYTTEEYFSQFKDKKSVISTFGIPKSKKEFEGLEIWNYTVVKNINSLYSKTNYVEFHFQDEKLVNYIPRGDFSQRKKVKRKKLGKLIGIGLVSDFILLVLIDAAIYGVFFWNYSSP